MSHFAAHCSQRLERIMQTGAKKGVRRPTLEEVEQAMVTVLSSFSHEHHVTLNLLGVFRDRWIFCSSFNL